MKKRKTWQQLALHGVSSGVLPLTKSSVLSHLLKWGRLLTANRDAFKENSQEKDWEISSATLCFFADQNVLQCVSEEPESIVLNIWYIGLSFLYHLWYAVQWKWHRTLTLPLHFGSWAGLIRAQPWHEQQFIAGPTQRDKQNSRQFKIAN